jgi:subtilase family serine protease
MSSTLRRIVWSSPFASAAVALATLCPPQVGAAPAPRAQPAPAASGDLGPTAPTETITVSLVLKVKNPDALEAFVAATQDPSSPTFHRFLSVREFADRFAPSQADIAIIKRYLDSFGITTDEVFADRLLIKATGTADAFQRAFTVEMRDVSRRGKRFHRPRHAPRIPLLLRDLLVAIQGLSNEPQFAPMHHSMAELTPLAVPRAVVPASGATATGVPGSFTVGDVANLYNINPLYDAGFTGAGRTVGIATLANFDPADAFAYWDLVGLSVDPNRLTQVHVDGGGELSADAGSGETALDVEQSGGLAPGAKMVVYDAPNSDAGFIDVFYKAASDNLVDSLSVSWGSAEPFYFEAVVGEDRTPQLLAFHQVFLESAAQGISMFCAAGDGGAFDINGAFNDPVANVLTVDIPAGDPAITAAGGTTVPVTFNVGPGTPDFVVATEQIWGWQALENYLVEVLGPDFLHALFPAGGGGGVSTFWPVPAYQKHTGGIRKTERNQSIIFDDGTGPVDLLDLPAKFAGRNVPDISLNGDPVSGYLLLSTLDGGLLAGFGGTSFVAPQLNGISALISSATGGGRLGLWNPMLYRFKDSFGASKKSPIVDITAGDNWFYSGVRGYEPGAGLGVLNVANLAAAVAKERRH